MRNYPRAGRDSCQEKRARHRRSDQRGIKAQQEGYADDGERCCQLIQSIIQLPPLWVIRRHPLSVCPHNSERNREMGWMSWHSATQAVRRAASAEPRSPPLLQPGAGESGLIVLGSMGARAGQPSLGRSISGIPSECERWRPAHGTVGYSWSMRPGMTHSLIIPHDDLRSARQHQGPLRSEPLVKVTAQPSYLSDA
jgi:hypothetical protein